MNDINENAEEFLDTRKVGNRRSKGLEKVTTVDSGLAHCSAIVARFQEGGVAKIGGVDLPAYLNCPHFLKNRKSMNGESIGAVFLQLL